MPSFTTIIYVIFVAYVGNSVWTIYQLFSPPTCTQANNCATPFLKSNPQLVLALYTSTKLEVRSDSDLSTLWQSEQFDYKTSLNVNVNVTLPRSTRSNGTLYVHAFVGPKFSKHGSSSAASFLSSPYASYSAAALTVFMVPEAEAFSLLGSSQDGAKSSNDKKATELPVAHWRQKLILSVMEELVSFPLQSIPRELSHLMRLSPKKEYLPMLYIDTLQSRIADLKPINKNSSHMELSITYTPISYGRLRLQMQFQSAMQTMATLGFTEKDTDEVKGIFLDTNLYLLCITFIVAAFHLLFDFLAFKNDIIFWRRKKTLVGTSTRSVIWRCFSHAVIFVYLVNEKTSMLVLIPAGIGTLIEVWKMAKVLKVSVRKTKWFYTLKFGELSAEEKKTEEYDAQSMKYLSYLLYPLCIGGAIYSLLYTPHRSWYSWCIQSLVNGVYVFGFLFMLPQLFVNYKLKSVAHLPWKAFMYKAFNTFIDDIFAFIITMPTAHRVACFRDDVIFLIYLYQRWLYPVDKTRMNEFGETFDGESDDKKKKKSQ